MKKGTEIKLSGQTITRTPFIICIYFFDNGLVITRGSEYYRAKNQRNIMRTCRSDCNPIND